MCMCVRIWFVLVCDCIKKDVRLDGCMYVHVCASGRAFLALHKVVPNCIPFLLCLHVRIRLCLCTLCAPLLPRLHCVQSSLSLHATCPLLPCLHCVQSSLSSAYQERWDVGSASVEDMLQKLPNLQNEAQVCAHQRSPDHSFSGHCQGTTAGTLHDWYHPQTL